MTVDTLKIARQLEGAGLPKSQAEAITNVLGQLAADDLVTRDYLDRRLLQHTLAVIAAVAAIAGLLKLFG
jgi:hypothetical protein